MTSLSNQAFRDNEMRTINPPAYEYPEEICDRCGVNALDDSTVRVRDPRYPGKGVWSYYCGDCAEPAEPCNDCLCFRCVCGDDDDR